MMKSGMSPTKSICNVSFVLAAIAAVTILCPVASSGQTPTPYIPNTDNVGLPTNGVFSGGSIDSVQLQNGNLHIDIPLLHLSGIGMDTNFHFTYDNQLFNTTTVNYGTVQLTQQWKQISIGRNGFAQVSDPLSGVLKYGTHQESWQCYSAIIIGNVPTIIWSATLTYIDFMSFTDPEGTGHDFPVFGYENNNPGPCTPTNTYPASSYSKDATGYNLTLSPVSSAIVSLTDKHGTQYTLGPGGGTGNIGAYINPEGQEVNPEVSPTAIGFNQITKVEDSNGNTISGSVASNGVYTITDTVGRSITETGSSGFTIPQMAREAGANEPQTISYTDQNSAMQTITINYSPYTLNIPSLCGNPVVCGPAVGTPAEPVPTNLPTSIVLQNGDTYTFNYLLDNQGYTLGEISSITLPTGGVISYTWSGLQGISNGIVGRKVLSRTVTANGQSSTWQYIYTPGSVMAGGTFVTGATATVTDPYMNDTVYTLGWFGMNLPTSTCQYANQQTLVTQEVSYNGSQYANQPIATKTIGYGLFGGSLGGLVYLPTSNVLTWNSNGATTETDTNYDGATTCNAPGTFTRGNLTSKTVYDYGVGAHGALLNNTLYSYLHDQNSAYAAANIADRVSQVSVYSASSALVAQTTTGYDNFSSGGQGGVASTSGTTAHDYTNFSTANTLRGLPTSVTKYTGPSTAAITTYMNYNDLGKETVATDGRGNSTTYTYGVLNAFLATTTYPSTGNGVPHVITTSYDLNTGLLMSQTDFNNNPTTYTYDSRMRPLVTSRPDGGSTTNSYPDPNQMRTAVSEDSSRTEVTTTDLDGLGRPVSVISTSDAACGFLIVDTTYDLIGRKNAVSNPHCVSSQATDGWSRFTYDAIGRLTSKQNPDSTAQTWSFNGNVVDSYDETQRHWRRTYDAEARLTQVLEPDGTTSIGNAPALETDYSYDVLNNLLSVVQWGGTSGSPAPNGPITRSFAYDGVSRLIAANNPENASAQSPAGQSCAGTGGTWTTCYAYDPNSNLTAKRDNRGIQIAYSYDAMNRVLGKTYSDGTPSVTLTYDTTSCSGGSNTKGELTSAVAGTGSITAQRLMCSYNQVGRLLSEQQCTPANCGGSSYALAISMIGPAR